MRKKRLLKRAFTLTELLVVVIVLGVLASVAVPKFSRVLETRRTTEAESILTSLRTEQEHRCVLGKEYQIIPERVESLASAKDSRNYTYSLTRTGAKATSSKGYTIAMPAYQNGQLCCEGDYCSSLNKSYPSCSSLSVPKDECAAPCEDCTCEEYAQSNRCECDASYKSSNPCICTPYSCACSTYAVKNPCECRPNSCACPSYAAANPCECSDDPCDCPSTSNTCACSTYASANPCECSGDCTCEEDPDQAKCQNCSNATYAAANPCECSDDPCDCPSTSNTCACSTYASANPCECDAAYAKKNPCVCAPNTCACSDYAFYNRCECSDDPCDCDEYYYEHPCECDSSYAAAHRCECDAAYAKKNPCVCAPKTCACSTYAAKNPCVCAPKTCACSTYAAKNPCECSSDPCDCPLYENTCSCQVYAFEVDPCGCLGKCDQSGGDSGSGGSGTWACYVTSSSIDGGQGCTSTTSLPSGSCTRGATKTVRTNEGPYGNGGCIVDVNSCTCK